MERYRIVGLSGTSGGAVCALMAWRGLVRRDRELAARTLEGFWADNSATAPYDVALNAFTVWAAAMQDYTPLPAVSPYENPGSTWGLELFRSLLEKQVDFDRIEPQGPDGEPMLLIGAVDVRSGEFHAFNSRTERITSDVVLASAAIPNLFRAVGIDGGAYWDGLFSQNPPVRELLQTRPDEIWVIQVNPKEREKEPTTMSEISDRRNELAGNLSLHQELHFIERIDAMLATGVLSAKAGYRPITIRVIELSRSRTSLALGTASKLNRDPRFIQGLIAHGKVRAAELLAAIELERAWLAGDLEAIMSRMAPDAEIVSEAPFAVAGPLRGDDIREHIAAMLARRVEFDLTRKAVSRNLVSWIVRSPAGEGLGTPGRVQARIEEGRIELLRFGPSPVTPGF
jgi:NTE family protein